METIWKRQRRPRLAVDAAVWVFGTALLLSLVRSRTEYHLIESWQLVGRGVEVSTEVPPLLVDETIFLAAEALENEREPRIVARYELAFGERSSPSRVAASAETMSEIRWLAASRREQSVAVVTDNHSITLLNLSTLATKWTSPLPAADGDAQVFFSSRSVRVLFSSPSSTTVASFCAKSGRSLWTANGTTTSEPRPPGSGSAWREESDFWEYVVEEESSKNGREMVSQWLSKGMSLSPWTRAFESARSYEDEGVVTFRTRRGLEAFDAVDGSSIGSSFLPAAALHGDFDGDGALDSVSVVESRRPSPRRKKVRRGKNNKKSSKRDDDFYFLPPCVGVATRGFPAVERLDDFSLCHESGVEREVEAHEKRERRKKQREIFAAPPVFLDDGVFFAVSKGIFSKQVYERSRHGFLVYRAPTWNERGQGRVLVVENGASLVVVVGASAVALYSPENGDQLAYLDLDFKWDDETAVFVLGYERFVVVVTNFATYGVRIASNISSPLILKLLTFFCALAPLSFSLVPLFVFPQDDRRFRDKKN